MKKELWITVDYVDDIVTAKRHYTERDLDAMMAYGASLGVARVQWIVDTMWAIYDADAPGGFDVLAVACAAAHRHGMKFDAVFKPFEGARGYVVLPHGLPLPDDAPVLEELAGLIHAYRPQVAEHPEMNFSRMAGRDEDPGGRIAAIRLVKPDDKPCDFGPDDLSLWTSPRNGGYTRYNGPVTFAESTEWRLIFPYTDRPYRIVTLDGLQLPDDTRYVMVRRERGGAEFRNAVEQIIELVNERGELVPCTPALRLVDGAKTFETFQRDVNLNLTRFSRRPEARALLDDRDGFLALCDGMRHMDAGWEDATLNEGDELVAVRGKSRQRTGAMHPIYPEVREDWLKHVRFCMDRGVDGVNMRTANHNRFYEPWAFGFNPPVIDRMTHPGNSGEASRINGDAYTLFLREAAELLHGAGKDLGVTIHGNILHHCDGPPNNTEDLLNIEWQWELWLKEIADYVEYRGAFAFRPENQRPIAERIGLVAREAGIPFVYQSNRGSIVVHFDGPHPTLAYEMDWVRKHPDVAVYDLYEMANFARLDPERGFEGSPDIGELVRRHWRP